MTIDFDSSGATAAAQAQASRMMLHKSLRMEQQNAAQLLQSLPGTSLPAARAGPAVSGLGQMLDAFG
jgi:hypothetical protein